MPLPLLVIAALPWIVSALEWLAAWAARAVLLYAAEQAWEHAKPKLLQFCHENAPQIVRYMLSRYLGVEVGDPIGPWTITEAINVKLQQAGVDLVLQDVTDADAVKADIREWAVARFCVALPGVILHPHYFAPGNREKLRKAIFGAIHRELQLAFSQRRGNWLNDAATASLWQQLQAQYEFTQKQPIEDARHETSRIMARWYRRHLRKHWVPR